MPIREKITRLQGKSHRPGLFQCNECREHFTVMVGGVMERSHIPLHKWVLGFHLMAASKKGISAHQLYRMLGFGSYRTAWFMAHRIREAMKLDADAGPIGGEGKVVEADETYFGRARTRVPHRSARVVPTSSARPLGISAPSSPLSSVAGGSFLPCPERHQGKRPRNSGPQR